MFCVEATTGLPVCTENEKIRCEIKAQQQQQQQQQQQLLLLLLLQQQQHLLINAIKRYGKS